MTFRFPISVFVGEHADSPNTIHIPKSILNKTQLKNVKVYGQVINPFDIYQSVDGLDLDTGLSYYNRSWVIGLEIGF